MTPNSDTIWNFWLPIKISWIWRWEFLLNIRVSKMNIFENVDPDLNFQGHLLQELDGKPQCDHFGANFMKIGWIVW